MKIEHGVVYVWDRQERIGLYVSQSYTEDGTGYQRSQNASAWLTPDEVRGLIVQLQAALKEIQQ